MALDREIALAEPAARIGAVEDRQMLVLEARSAFKRHRAADMDIGALDIGLGEAQIAQKVEAEIVQLRVAELERAFAEGFAERELVEHELDVEGGREARFDLGDLAIAETLGLEREHG